MEWVCLHDRQRLNQQGHKLHCPKCSQNYDVYQGIPLFTTDGREHEQIQFKTPHLEELWELMKQRSSDSAANHYCKTHQCSRMPYRGDWKFLFSIPKDGCVLEIGAGFGDDTVDLNKEAAQTISLVPTLINAEILQKHLMDAKLSNLFIAVVSNIKRLPLENKSIDAIAIEDVASCGFNISNKNFSAIASEWKRILSPGGTLFLGMRNPYNHYFGFHFLYSFLQTKAKPISLNRLIKQTASQSTHGRLGLTQTIRGMIKLGFKSPTIYVPLPDENKSEIVIPVEDAQVVRYFLNNLIRKNSFSLRVSIAMANILVKHNLFRYFVPYYYLIFKLDNTSQKTDRGVT